MVDQINISVIPSPEIIDASKEKIITSVVDTRTATLQGMINSTPPIAWKIFLEGMSSNDPYVVSDSTQAGDITVIVNCNHPYWTHAAGRYGERAGLSPPVRLRLSGRVAGACESFQDRFQHDQALERSSPARSAGRWSRTPTSRSRHQRLCRKRRASLPYPNVARPNGRADDGPRARPSGFDRRARGEAAASSSTCLSAKPSRPPRLYCIVLNWSWLRRIHTICNLDSHRRGSPSRRPTGSAVPHQYPVQQQMLSAVALGRSRG